MKISVVCPFYNEELILKKAIEGIIDNLKSLDHDWELIIVNDGSIDNSYNIADKTVKKSKLGEKVKIISYDFNQGRGYALKKGIENSNGEIIITTEIDLSWGDKIVHQIVEKFILDPHLDVVVASPNLKGGGYKSVPYKRVLISKIGNFIIRLLFTRKITMNTGMTRGYKKHWIKTVKISEKGKEFHLEVLLKLIDLGANVGEIPAILEWKNNKLISGNQVKKRKSSSKTKKLIFSHLNFAIFANPIRYFWLFSLILFLTALVIGIYSIYLFIQGKITIYLALVALLLFISGLIFFGFGILTVQNRQLMKELWEMRYFDRNSIMDKNRYK
ncbi:MAG: glycosyltransferase family 2 protein [Candidatus Hodarchaeota archaeon]